MGKRIGKARVRTVKSKGKNRQHVHLAGHLQAKFRPGLGAREGKSIKLVMRLKCSYRNIFIMITLRKANDKILNIQDSKINDD